MMYYIRDKQTNHYTTDVISLNIFYLHTICKLDRTQVMTTLVKSFPLTNLFKFFNFLLLFKCIIFLIIVHVQINHINMRCDASDHLIPVTIHNESF